MNKIDTYEISKEVSDILASELSANALRQKFAALSVTCLSSEEQRQALVQAIEDKCDPSLAKEVFAYADNLLDEHMWRNTTPEMKAKLKERGCDEPFVVCTKTSEAVDAVTSGYPIFAIRGDGTYYVCQSELDIKQAEQDGCIFGTSQFAMDDIMEKILQPESEV